jgi:hypothetical protein
LDCVEALLQHQPALQQQNKLGDNILHGAAWGGRDQVLDVLLALPGAADLLTARNNAGQTPFDLAKTPTCGAKLQQKQMELQGQEMAAREMMQHVGISSKQEQNDGKEEEYNSD